MRYGLGLDIGITSVGYATVLLNDKDEPIKIIRMGSRIFDAAENPKDGSSLALPRREKRGLRRLVRRKRHRKERIRQLIMQKCSITQSEIEEIYNAPMLSDIYEIRAKSLDECLCKEDFVRLLIHLSQRRGFKSNRKVDSSDKKAEAGKLLTAIEENKSKLHEKGYRTIGEMLYKDEKFKDVKRNKGESYSNTFSRADYENEIKQIFTAQRKYGNKFATEAFEEEYLNIYLSQRSFDDGPGGDSPFGGNQIEKMLGKCTFEHDEFRAVKASYSFEYFNLLSKINAIKIVSNNEKRSLSTQEREAIIKLAFDKKALSYASLRKALSLSDNETFNISYGKKEELPETEKKTKFSYLTTYHTFKKAYGDVFDSWSVKKKNNLAYALSVYKNDEKIADYLTKNGFDKTEIDIALSLPSFSKTCNLSIKALDKIIPYLEQGFLYNEACEKAGYDFRNQEQVQSKYLPANPMNAPELEDITNPVVRRAISQTIKVINGIVREMDESPVYVNIELARELAKSRKERNDIEKAQAKNRENNEKIVEELKSTFHILNPTGQDIVKLKLFKEQDGICPYSLKPLDIKKLFDIGYTDIDHIVPYSISFDDTYNNKVLVLSSENRQKGNRLPLQYLQGQRKDDFTVWVNNSNLRGYKKKNLLKEKISDDDISGFKKRNLQDTQYISRFILNFLKKYLLLSESKTGRKNCIVSVNGGATAYVRKRWGIQKIRENGDVHHAVDAVVIACFTQGLIKRISKYSDYKEIRYAEIEGNSSLIVDKKTGEVIDKFPLPYEHFRDEIEMRCSENPTRILAEKPLATYGTGEEVLPIFVSRMPRRKVTGAAHKETIRSTFNFEGNNYTVIKTDIKKLKLKNGEIENYYNPESDRLLYNALKERLSLYNGNGEKAFEQPFYKPKADGTQGPLVKKVKIYEKATMSVSVLQNTAVADNGSMVRVDVFYIENEGYYLVPIYVADTVKKELPNKAIVAHKPYSEWKEMNEKDFIFSLYPNDLIMIKTKNPITMSLVSKDSTLSKSIQSNVLYLYYKATGITNATITVINHDNTYTVPSLGVKRLESLEKYSVDVLGNINKVGKEKRVGFK